MSDSLPTDHQPMPDSVLEATTDAVRVLWSVMVYQLVISQYQFLILF